MKSRSVAAPRLLGKSSRLLLWATLAGVISASARSAEPIPDEPKSGLHRLFHRSTAPAATHEGPVPPTAAEIAQRIDHAAESIRNDGLVVLKQPDVFSQARMTKYRREFEEIMTQEKSNFKVILAGRVARLDQASLDSQTSLTAALTPPGTSIKVAAPTTDKPPVTAALDGTADAPRFLDKTTLGQAAGNLGLEPNSVLDEQKSYLDRLHQIRRVNLGNDIADSAGYGLYLIRMPVSITPGECTVHGHGAEATVTIKHEFPPNFLASTFRNLVINDLVDQLGPPIYEVVRARVDHELARKQLKADAAQLAVNGRQYLDKLSKEILRAGQEGRVKSGRFQGNKPIQSPFPSRDVPTVVKDPAAVAPNPPPPDGALPEPLGSAPNPRDAEYDQLVDQLANFVSRANLPASSQPAPTISTANEFVTRRIKFLTKEATRVYDRWVRRPDVNKDQAGGFRTDQRNIQLWVAGVLAQDQTRQLLAFAADDQVQIQAYLNLILVDLFFSQDKPDLDRFTNWLAELYSTVLPDDVAVLNEAVNLDSIEATPDTIQGAAINLKLAEVNAKLADFANIRTIRLPSDRVAKRSYPVAPRELADFFLAANLETIAEDIQRGRPTRNARASDIRSYLRQQLSVAYDVMSRPSAKVPAAVAPLDDQAAMDQILGLIHNRAFTPADTGELTLSLFDYYRQWIAKLPSNLEGRSLGALCWAIAVDAALLDEALREQARITFQTNSLPCPDLDSLRFYFVQPDLAAQASGVFNDYVTNRWPVITFALDPVVDQQNILDNFSLRRDLQLALAFAFSTGQIGLNQLITFRRKIQQDEETIALNKTVTSFAHGNETFGWRFTPRFQTPPSQGNLATLGSTLLRGGPGPNYGLRKSKIEAGQRELVAVVIMPSFLPTIRVESSGNWFRLDDPEHLEVRTRRMLEQGRRVQELRVEVASASDAACYRPADIRHLRTKIDQIDAMLPIQSKVVALPFDNAPAGFDLFTEGTTALVPELNGFEGAERVIQGRETDLLIFGKFISIHETRVVAGGRELKNAVDNNAGYEILSREVIRVHLPGDVQPSETRDDKAFVEIYLATPNGISNRLLIPYQSQKSDDKAPDALDDPDGTVRTTINTTQKVFPPKGFKLVPTPPATPGAPPTELAPDPKPVSGFSKPSGFTNSVSESQPPTPTPAPKPTATPPQTPPPAPKPAATPSPVPVVTPPTASNSRVQPGTASLVSNRVPQADPLAALKNAEAAARAEAARTVAAAQADAARTVAAAQAKANALVDAATKAVAGLPDAPGPANLPPLPTAVDPALIRTSLDEVKAAVAKLPTAVVMPTPIVVMPPTPPKPKRQSRLGRALDWLHPDKKGAVPPVPRP